MKRSEAIFYFKDLVRDIRNIFIIIHYVLTITIFEIRISKFKINMIS